MCQILLQLAYFSLVWLCIVEGRKYDIEAESQKLYGEDLKGALKKFRKSYDYVQILKEKAAVLQAELQESYMYLDDYYKPQIDKKILEILGIKEEQTKKDEKPVGRQNEEEEEHSTTLSDVQVLDQYVADKRLLTVPEVNSVTNLAFEFAGKIIHGMVKDMGGNDISDDQISTKLPMADKDDKDSTTTKKHHDHSVTNEGQFISTAKPELPEPEEDKFAFRAYTLNNQ